MPLRLALALSLLVCACSPYEELDSFPVSDEFLNAGQVAPEEAPGANDAPASPAQPAEGEDDGPAADATRDPAAEVPTPDADADDGPAGGGAVEPGEGPPGFDDGDDLLDPPHEGEPEPPEGDGGGADPECEPSQDLCDGADNDCDGEIDEGDPRVGQACETGAAGACGDGAQICRFGRLTCAQTLQPAFETCDGVDNDCDGRIDDGFDLDGDPRHCGGCGVVCDVPGAEPACEQGACIARHCLPGFHDVDGDPTNGCEVERAGRTFHVDIATAEGGDGSAEAPFRQITEATAAVEEGDIIEVAQGFYAGPVVLDTPFTTLRSDSNFGTWIDGDGQGPALEIAADDVRVRRMAVNAGGAATGVRVIDRHRFRMTDVRIQNVRGDATGLLILGGSRGQLHDVTVFDVRATDAPAHGVRVQGHEGLYADALEIEDISGGTPISGGLTLLAADGAVLANLEVGAVSAIEEAYGVAVDSTADATLIDLSASDVTAAEAAGVVLFASADAALRGGQIGDIAGRRAAAIRAERAHFAEVSGLTLANIAAVTEEGDEVSGRAYGALMSDSGDVTIRRTLIHDVTAHGAWGIYANAGVERLLIEFVTVAAIDAAADGAGAQVQAGATATIRRSIVATAGTRQGLRNAEANAASAFVAETTDSFGHPQGNFVGLERGDGNVEVDPLFTSPDEGDCTLAPTSTVGDRGVYGVAVRLLP